MSRDSNEHAIVVDILAREAPDERDLAEQSAVEKLRELQDAHLMQQNLLALEMRLVRTELTKQGNQHAKVIELLRELVVLAKGKNGHTP